jgi:putative PIN family toxin of toxin-antitoxin system
MQCHIIGDMTKLRVVLDTNVLVAAARSRNGASFALLTALRHDQFRLLASVPLFLEYEAVLKRPEQLAAGRRSLAMVNAFLDALALRLEPVSMFYLWRPQLRDAADEMVLETALNGRADALVTFNIGDFKAAEKFALPVIDPAAFLQLLRQGEN